MNAYLKTFDEAAEELEDALRLECDENSAVVYGTRGKWRKIR